MVYQIWLVKMKKEGRKEMFYIMTHATCIYSYMESDIQ